MSMPRRQKSVLCIIYTVLVNIKFGSSFLIGILPNGQNLRPQTFSSSRAATAVPDSLLVPPGILGPPEPLGSLKIGQCVDAFRALQYNCDETDKLQFTIERVSLSPDIFCLRNFVTPSECTQIQSTAEESDMAQAETVTKDDDSSRKNCTVAWISSSGQNTTSVVSDLVASTANIFISNNVLSHPSAGVEDLQVLKYGTGGEFIHHHDGEPRILTVIYYINGVGGTWFPLARTNESEDFCERAPSNKAQALELVKGLKPGTDGLLVKGAGNGNDQSIETSNASREENNHVAWVNKGDAIAFYNYLDNGSAQMDWKALHCGLPTTKDEGTKWIANHWYRLNVLADM